MLPSVGKPDTRRAARLLAPIILAMLARELLRPSGDQGNRGK